MEHFIEDDAYDALIAALVNVEPSPFTGSVTNTEIIWVLAETAGIYPARIQADAYSESGAHKNSD